MHITVRIIYRGVFLLACLSVVRNSEELTAALADTLTHITSC